MLRPVLDPVLGRDILSRYTAFASSVGAPAPMEHLMQDGAAQPARYETYVENLHQVTQAIRKNYVINLQMDLRFLALQLASAMEQAGRTETRRVQMLERKITILQDEAGRLKAAPLAHRAEQKTSSGQLPAGNVPGYGLVAVESARRAAMAPLQPLIPENGALADPVPPVQRILSEQNLLQSRRNGQAEELLAPSARPNRQEQNKVEALLPSPAQRVLPDTQTAVPVGEKKRTQASPERPESNRPAGQSPAAMPGTPAVVLPYGGAVRHQETRENPASAAGLPAGTGRSAPNRPAARVPLGHMEPDDQDAENAPLPDPRPARLLRPEPSQRVLRTDAPERASTWQENESSASFARPLPHSGPAQSEKTADRGSVPGSTGENPAVPTVGHAAGDPRTVQTDPEAAATRLAPELTAVPLVHTVAGNWMEAPAAGRAAAIETAAGALPGTQDPGHGKTAAGTNAVPAVAGETTAVATVRPAPGMTTAPLVHAAPAQAEKESVRTAVPGQTASSATAMHPVPGVTAAPLVHAAPVQAEKEPARMAVPGQTSSHAAVPAPQRESNRQTPTPAGRDSTSAADRTAPAPAQEPAAAAVRPAPGVKAAPLVHAAPVREDKESVRRTAPGQTSSDVAAPAPQREKVKQTPVPESGSYAPSGILPARAPAKEQAAPLRQAPAVASAPLVYAHGGVEPSLSPQMPLRGTGEGSIPKTSASAPSGTAVTAAMPRTGEAPRKKAALFRRLDAFVRAPMVPAAGSMLSGTKGPMSTATGTTAGNTRPAAGMPSAVPARKTAPEGANRVLLSAANSAGTPGAAVPGPALREPTIPAGSPAPMELRRGSAPAAPMTSAPGTSSWAPEGIRTVHRTRTVQRETKQETPSTVTVRLPGQSAVSAAVDIGPAEVERIAEKVYRQIEERLRSEKMRRGM